MIAADTQSLLSDYAQANSLTWKNQFPGGIE